MKRFISLILCLVLLCTGSSIAFAAEAEGTDIPTVYVLGSSAELVIDEPGGGFRDIYPIALPENFIADTVEANKDIFIKAFFTQKWDDFCVALQNIMIPLFEEIKLDENGNVRDNSHVRWYGNRDRIDGSRVNGKYPTERFVYEYDFRVDPYISADGLHTYIERVLQATGESKVALVGRCMGGCITAAYMEKYDGEYVADYIQYCSALYGATQCSKAFCGEIYLESGGVERFVQDLNLFADTVYNDLLQGFVTVLRKTYGLDIACWAVNNVYKDIYLKIVPPILIETFGTFPGFWSMVSDRDYEKAKETVFYGADKDKWQNFIRIIDNYHYNVQVKTPELFDRYRKNGIEIANIVKYGCQTIPVTRNSDMLSDQLCSVEDASFGATVATITKPLKKSYLKTADPTYLSPDKQIDASTCLMPDRTWFIKDMAHKEFPFCVDRLFDEIINNDGLTVFDSAEYPQYLVFDKEANTLSPMTEENMDTTARYRQSFFVAMKRFIKALYTVIRDLIESKRAEA